MKYLCLGYYDEQRFEALSGPELERLVAQCRAHDEALRASGRLLSVASLAAPHASTTIRPRGGKPVVTDGPFVETREVIGSFFLIEAADLDEAIRIASLHPAARLGETVGWGVEVRPIEASAHADGQVS
jgi:hypothetical protein